MNVNSYQPLSQKIPGTNRAKHLTMSLRTLMGECYSRMKLKERMIPESRVVEFSEVESEEECQRQITNNMRFIRLALKEHAIPITVVFNGSITKRKRCEEGSGGKLLRWRYPEFANTKKKCSKVPQLLQLLHILNERIKTKKNTTTVRDIYYGNIELFESQQMVEMLFQRIEAMFNVEKLFFNVVSTQKGLIYSGPRLQIGSQLFHAECQLVPYDQGEMIVQQNQQLKVIVLEKDAIFQQLIQCQEMIKDWIIVTGKGYPDHLSRELLHKLDLSLQGNVQFHIFTDSDPYGIDIVTKYMVKCPRLIHKGVLLNQLITRNTESNSMLVLLPLSLRDATFAMGLIRRLCKEEEEEGSVRKHTMRQNLKYEVQRQLFFQRKGEMNVVNNGNVQQYFKWMYSRIH